MQLALGLYKVIDSHFEEWKAYENALKMLFVSSDIEIYSKAKFKETFDRAESVTASMITNLLEEFSTVPITDKEGLKTIYTNFIDRVCKPDKKEPIGINTKGKEEWNKNYSQKDEFYMVNERNRNDEVVARDNEVFEERTTKLQTLINDVKLSDIEIYALNYIKDRNSEKHILLAHFTLKGIIQLANRAAYKVCLANKKGVINNTL